MPYQFIEETQYQSANNVSDVETIVKEYGAMS